MTNHEKVMAIMMTDPEREWTAPELARILDPHPLNTTIRTRIYSVLQKAEKYGFVRKTKTSPGRVTYWKLIG